MSSVRQRCRGGRRLRWLRHGTGHGRPPVAWWVSITSNRPARTATRARAVMRTLDRPRLDPRRSVRRAAGRRGRWCARPGHRAPKGSSVTRSPVRPCRTASLGPRSRRTRRRASRQHHVAPDQLRQRQQPRCRQRVVEARPAKGAKEHQAGRARGRGRHARRARGRRPPSRSARPGRAHPPPPAAPGAAAASESMSPTTRSGRKPRRHGRCGPAVGGDHAAQRRPPSRARPRRARPATGTSPSATTATAATASTAASGWFLDTQRPPLGGTEVMPVDSLRWYEPDQVPRVCGRLSRTLSASRRSPVPYELVTPSYT